MSRGGREDNEGEGRAFKELNFDAGELRSEAEVLLIDDEIESHCAQLKLSRTEISPNYETEINIYKFKYLITLSKEDNDTIKVIEKYNPKIIYQKSFGYGDALIEGIKNVQTKYLVICI